MLNRAMTIGAVVAAGLLASGCDRETARSQAWWDANRDEAKAMLVTCNSMAEAERAVSTDCTRALVAVRMGANAGTMEVPELETWVKR